jgi:hypothetical protein
MKTAMEQALQIDTDKIAIRKSVDFLLHLLDDFIPRGAFREAERRLYEGFERDGIELTTKLMRKEYEAWKDTQLELSKLTFTPPQS